MAAFLVGLRFGRLPGDVTIRRPRLVMTAPLATGCLLSIALSVLLTAGLDLCAQAVFR